MSLSDQERARNYAAKKLELWETYGDALFLDERLKDKRAMYETLNRAIMLTLKIDTRLPDEAASISETSQALCPYLHSQVQTPEGIGELVQVFSSRVAVILPLRDKLSFFKPGEVSRQTPETPETPPENTNPAGVQGVSGVSIATDGQPDELDPAAEVLEVFPGSKIIETELKPEILPEKPPF